LCADVNDVEVTPAMVEAGHDVLYQFGSDWADMKPAQFLKDFLSTLFSRMERARSGSLPGPENRSSQTLE
jgi:hypothetical protein